MNPLLACLDRALHSQARNKALTNGFQAIAEAYFEEYTDATEMDFETRQAFDHLFDMSFPSGETDDGLTADDLASKTQ